METTTMGYTRCDIGHSYWGYVGIMEKKMESTIVGSIGYILGLYRDDGKENRNYHTGFYRSVVYLFVQSHR